MMTETVLSKYHHSPKAAFPSPEDYGWCYTDEKSGNHMRDSRQGRDYVLGSQHKDICTPLLAQFGIETPRIDSIFRGREHDLLFLDSYGLVVRIGPLDIIDLAHPAIIQPIAWLNDDESDFTVAIYPGIQHINHNECCKKELIKFLNDTDQSTSDLNGDHNIGLINDIFINLDPDNFYSGTKKGSPFKKEKEDSFFDALDNGDCPAKAMENMMIDMYGYHPSFSRWFKAFQTHQPLRIQLWDAVMQESSEERHKKLSEFYRRCKILTQSAEIISTDQGESLSMALYKSWTGEKSDNLLKTQKHSPR